MPIKPENKARYPKDWKDVRHRILQRAKWRCEHPNCRARHDGRCQYAIDSGAEELGHCPRGKCAMPEGVVNEGKGRGMQTQDQALDTAVDKAWNRFEAELKRGQRTYPLAVECLYTDDTKTLMSKGHHDSAEFRKACEEWSGGPLQGWGKVRHGWGRTVPDSTGKYKFLMLPAKPHARGAYPTTTVIDDPAYDHDETPNAS